MIDVSLSMQNTAKILSNIAALSQIQLTKKVFAARVVTSTLVAKDVKKITFKVTQPFMFLAWQYVWVEIPQLSVPDTHGNRRAFSIFNTINDENTIEIVARLSNTGYKQSLFALDIGDEVIIHGPFGNSFIVSDTHQPNNIIMIAGGVGIAAFLPMIETIKNKKYPITCFLIYTNKSQEETPFLKELAELKNGGNFFDFRVKYEHFSWDDIRDVSARCVGSTEWWIAGPKPMINDVFTTLTAAGVKENTMVFENFYPTSKNNLTSETVNEQLRTGNLFAQAIQNSTNHSVITDADGTILFANKAAERITGFTSEEMIGNTPRLWGGMMSHEFYVDFWKKKQMGVPFQGEIINRRKNGELYYVLSHISPIFGDDKEVIGYIGTEEDITDLVEAARQQAQSRRFLDSVIENLPSMVFVKDAKDLKFVAFNKAGEELVGVKKEEMIGKTDYDFFPKEQADAFVQKDRVVLTEKKLVDIPEEPIVTKVKGKRTLHTKKIPILDAQNNPLYLLGISEDITEQKQARDQIERMNKFMIGREVKMAELKKEIAQLQLKNKENDATS